MLFEVVVVVVLEWVVVSLRELRKDEFETDFDDEESNGNTDVGFDVEAGEEEENGGK